MQFAVKMLLVTKYGFVIGCGGALDILSGALNRAPRFMVDNNLEWLFRLYKEPWRFKRQVFLSGFFLRLISTALIQRIRSV